MRPEYGSPASTEKLGTWAQVCNSSASEQGLGSGGKCQTVLGLAGQPICMNQCAPGLARNPISKRINSNSNNKKIESDWERHRCQPLASTRICTYVREYPHEWELSSTHMHTYTQNRKEHLVIWEEWKSNPLFYSILMSVNFYEMRDQGCLKRMMLFLDILLNNYWDRFTMQETSKMLLIDLIFFNSQTEFCIKYNYSVM